MSVVVGLLVVLAAVALAGPRGRRVRVRSPQPPIDRPGRAGADRDLGGVLVGVGAQLRAGATPAEAWSRALDAVVVGAVPSVDAVLAAVSGPGLRWRRTRADPGTVRRVRAVVAAAHLSDELGAPLAGVLDRIASAVAADEEAEGERRAALSGPRSTAQVLAWLPVLGVALGTLLGADPVGVVLSGGIGTGSAVLGGALVLLGRWWTSTLLVRAGRA